MNICSDIFESVIAGLYLDGGLEVAKKFIYENLLNITKKESKDVDYKSKLQEYAQKKKLGTIKYVQIEKRGPDHSPEFTCAVNMGSKRMESGVGKNKKQAEQNAAKVTLQMLQTHQKRGKQN